MPMNHDRRTRPSLITATEIATFAYCPEQWRMEHGLRLQPSNQASRRAGTWHHSGKAIIERIAGGAITLGQILAVLAVMALLLWLIFFR